MSDKRREVLQEIAADAEADVNRYEGLPFTGRTVAMIHGEQNAMIASLANIIETLLPEADDDS
ncbi:hypothetical protein LCGC14_1248820 [marine sediment metagenome]|uniref:Uncharacterized protein n=1 Tax=marine sediment metagenome TaxID=412755 RepID=A0A0F9NKX8_9ZZZZ